MPTDERTSGDRREAGGETAARVDPQRIEAARAELASGTFHVDPYVIAHKMMRLA